MKRFQAVYVPAGVPTFHLESARIEFEKSVKMLKSIDRDFVCPDDMLLTLKALEEYLDDVAPDIIVFQNITFANAAYITEVLRRFNCPVLLWTLREPVIDGTRLRLNSLTGAYSAANALKAFNREFEYVFGSPDDESVARAVESFVAAAKVRFEMNGLQVAAIGHTPQGFGFGRALDLELASRFGITLLSIEVRELIDIARGFTDEECVDFLEKSKRAMTGLENTPPKNLMDFARLYKAYWQYIQDNRIGALASRCWPDFFTAFGTPVCAVLSMLNDDGVASACEADIYGAISMWIGMRLSGTSVFFGDPVSLDEGENTITFWHCGAAACSMARRDTGAVVGVHPNRKIGPAMDFGLEAFDKATIFRVNRAPDGRFGLFMLSGTAIDKPKQFIGTSVVVKTRANCRRAVENSVMQGMEPHFAVIQGDHTNSLRMLARMMGFEIYSQDE